jgi:polysaccharide biosynthesis protein PslE
MKRSENSDLPHNAVRIVIRRQRLKGFVSFLLLFTPILAAAVFLDNSFRSDARIFVRLGRESVAMDPTVSASRTISVNDTREVEINSVLEIFQSRVLAERVVEKIGVETILSGELPGSSPETKPSAISKLISLIRVYKDGREVSLKERATTALLRELKTWTPKKSTVIGIEYSCESPEVAQMVVNEVIDVFKSEHARIHQTQGSFEFLNEQSELLRERLREAQSAIRDAKNEIGLVSVEGQKQLLQDELSVLETALINANAELKGSRARLKSLEQSVQELPERQVTQGVVVANDATSRMREVLYEVELIEREIATKYTEKHPDFRKAQEKLREAQDIYNSEADEREDMTTGINPARQQLEVSLLAETANYESLLGRCASLTEQHEYVSERLKKHNTDEVTLTELQRTVDQAEANFKNYSERGEQARLDQQLENQRISNVNIIQPASFVEKPASPNRVLLLAFGLMFAFCGGIGVMLYSEYSGNTPGIQSASTETSIALPQLASWTPVLQSEKEIAQQTSPTS